MSKKLISKWQEIDLDFFNEIFDYYWNGECNNKVLEIANIAYSDYVISGQWNSLFFGNKINIFDYPQWNRKFIKMLESSDINNTSIKLKLDYKISSCMLNKGPNISPLAYKEHYDLMMWAWFNGKEPKDMSLKDETRCPYWYYRKDGKIISPKTIEEAGPKKILIRAMEFEAWKDMVEDYINRGYIEQRWKGEGFPELREIRINPF